MENSSNNRIESETLLSNSHSCEVKIEIPVSSLSSNHTDGECSELDVRNTSNTHIVWNNVTYTAVVVRNKFRSKRTKEIEIIKNVNGKGVSGKFTAILGPSGAGKSTLLECIAGRKISGVSGSIYVTGGHKTKISFCSQKDDHLEELTVRETLLFASRLKNYNKRKENKWTKKAHIDNVNNILTQLGLECCENVRVGHCSGGQRKRLSIGAELVSRPNILVLDEPTSGLDSSSCMQCVKLLQRLSRGSERCEQMVVIASVHQPSSLVLSYIDYLYVLSKDGRCIYYGQTHELSDYFVKFEISCPVYQTPTDLVIEVASEEFGAEVIEKMEFNQQKNNGFYQRKSSVSCVSVSKIVQKTKSQSYPLFLHIWLLFWRTNIIVWRQPQLTTLRLFTSVTLALLISYCYKNRIGQFTGCVSSAMFDNFRATNFFGDATANLGYIFFTLLFITLSSKMPTILTFPLEMSVFIKERANGWYSCGSYYIAKSLADIPYQIIFPSIYCIISYFATYQILNIWRLSNFLLVSIILAFISQTMGLLIGALFANDFTSAVYSVALVIAPLILFSGFLVPFAEMPQYMHAISYVSWVRFAMEAILIGFYGYNRCDDRALSEQTVSETTTRSSHLSVKDFDKFINLAEYLNENNLMAEAVWLLNIGNVSKQLRESGESVVMTAFQLTDSQYTIDIIALLLVMLVLRVIAYYVLRWKVDRNT